MTATRFSATLAGALLFTAGATDAAAGAATAIGAAGVPAEGLATATGSFSAVAVAAAAATFLSAGDLTISAVVLFSTVFSTGMTTTTGLVLSTGFTSVFFTSSAARTTCCLMSSSNNKTKKRKIRKRNKFRFRAQDNKEVAGLIASRPLGSGCSFQCSQARTANG
jgi:hypothetical protein